MIENVNKEVKELENKYGEVSKLENNERRKYFVALELLKIKLQNDDKQENINWTEKIAPIKNIDNLQNQLKLKGVYSNKSILSLIDKVIRLVSIWQCLVTCSLYLVFPCILLSPFEVTIFYIFNINRKYKMANFFKILVSKSILLVSGVKVIVQYETTEEETFTSKPSIVCFSHGSTIDAFLISASIKIKNYVMVNYP